jgi:hypothetical protein
MKNGERWHRTADLEPRPGSRHPDECAGRARRFGHLAAHLVHVYGFADADPALPSLEAKVTVAAAGTEGVAATGAVAAALATTAAGHVSEQDPLLWWVYAGLTVSAVAICFVWSKAPMSTAPTDRPTDIEIDRMEKTL